MIYTSARLTESQVRYLERAAAVPIKLSFCIWDLGPKQTGSALVRRGYIRRIPEAATFRITDAGRLVLGMHKRATLDLAYLIMGTANTGGTVPLKIVGELDTAVHQAGDITFDVALRAAYAANLWRILQITTFEISIVTFANGCPRRFDYLHTIHESRIAEHPPGAAATTRQEPSERPTDDESP